MRRRRTRLRATVCLLHNWLAGLASVRRAPAPLESSTRANGQLAAAVGSFIDAMLALHILRCEVRRKSDGHPERSATLDWLVRSAVPVWGRKAGSGNPACSAMHEAEYAPPRPQRPQSRPKCVRMNIQALFCLHILHTYGYQVAVKSVVNFFNFLMFNTAWSTQPKPG